MYNLRDDAIAIGIVVVLFTLAILLVSIKATPNFAADGVDGKQSTFVVDSDNG